MALSEHEIRDIADDAENLLAALRDRGFGDHAYGMVTAAVPVIVRSVTEGRKHEPQWLPQYPPQHQGGGGGQGEGRTTGGPR